MHGHVLRVHVNDYCDHVHELLPLSQLHFHYDRDDVHDGRDVHDHGYVHDHGRAHDYVDVQYLFELIPSYEYHVVFVREYDSLRVSYYQSLFYY